MVPLCRYAFLSIVVASMGTAQSAWLFKNLRAKPIAKASMAAITLSGCAGAAMALAGMAYWSLATQNVVYVALNTAPPCYPPTSTRPRLARRHQGLLLPLHLRMALLAV